MKPVLSQFGISKWMGIYSQLKFHRRWPLATWGRKKARTGNTSYNWRSLEICHHKQKLRTLLIFAWPWVGWSVFWGSWEQMVTPSIPITLFLCQLCLLPAVINEDDWRTIKPTVPMWDCLASSTGTMGCGSYGRSTCKLISHKKASLRCSLFASV